VSINKFTTVNRKIPYKTQLQIFPWEFSLLRLSELIENSVGLPAATLKGKLPCKTLIFLLLSFAALVSSQPTLCFAHGLPFTVANAVRPTSFSIWALYTSIGGHTCKNLPLSVVRIY
jgi:hypothetical protein